MEAKYIGDFPIRFYSLTDFSGEVKPGDVITISDELFQKQYANDSRWEAVGKSKSKKEVKPDDTFEYAGNDLELK